MDVLTFLIKKALIRIHCSGTITTIIFLMVVRTLYKHLWYHTIFPDYRLFLWFLCLINIVHGAENGLTDGNPESWVEQTWLFPVSINAAGPTMYCVHPPLGLDFASVIHCQCSVWRWSLWRQSADLQPQAWEAPSKDFVSPDHVIVILSSSLSFQDSFFFTEKYLTTYDKTIRSPMS